MLNTLWQILIWILSICGILLISIICIFLLLLILVLFVPIRYKGEGQKDTDSIYAKFKVTWLFHLFYIEMQYHNKKLIHKIRIFFFCIYDSSKPPKEKKDTAGKKSTTIKEKKNELKKVEPEETKAESANEVPRSKRIKIETDTEKKDLTWYERILQKFKNILYTIRRFCAKMKKALENAEYYISIFQEEETRRVLSSCKRLLMKAFKSILPQNIHANLLIGTGSPDTTGYLLALLGMLYPYLGNNIFIEPDFENMVLEGSFQFKGRILLFTLAMITLKIYFNKGLRSLIRKLKREEI